MFFILGAPPLPPPPPVGLPFSLFAGGLVSSGVSTNSIEKYDHGTDAVTSAQNLGSAITGLAGTGNYEISYFMQGSGFHDKYVYATDTRSAATNGLTTNRNDLTATGNLDVGMFMGGFVAAPVATNDEVNYATEVVTNKSALHDARQALASTGVPDFAWVLSGFAGASPLNNVDRFEYATNTDRAGTHQLSAARYGAAACGTPTGAIVGAGFNVTRLATTEKYDYATETGASSTALGFARTEVASAGNATFGLITGGDFASDTYDEYTDKYTHATDVVSAGTQLSTGRQGHTGVSADPGGL